MSLEESNKFAQPIIKSLEKHKAYKQVAKIYHRT